LAVSVLHQINQAHDDISKALAPIFARAVVHNEKEMQNARERRERGNPPGKSKQTVGDQLTWEQILTAFAGKKRLWIVTDDGDYGTFHQDEGFLNHFLYEELRQVNADAEAYLFKDINDAIKHFAATTGVKADKLPSLEKAEEIKKEVEELPPLGWLEGNSAEIAGVLIRGWHDRNRAEHHTAFFAPNTGYHPEFYPTQLGLPAALLEVQQPITSSGKTPSEKEDEGGQK